MVPYSPIYTCTHTQTTHTHSHIPQVVNSLLSDRERCGKWKKIQSCPLNTFLHIFCFHKSKTILGKALRGNTPEEIKYASQICSRDGKRSFLGLNEISSTRRQEENPVLLERLYFPHTKKCLMMKDIQILSFFKILILFIVNFLH